MFQLKFEWDPQKAQSNLSKHGIAFVRATSVFLDPLAATIPDDVHSSDEQRWVTIGVSDAGSLVVVVHTYEEMDANLATVRIISARSATPAEVREYEEGVP